MGSLESSFIKEDLDFLIQAINDWETIGTQGYNMAMYIKQIPLPPEEDESHEMIRGLKEQFRQQEAELLKLRNDKQEKATFLKAKLFLARRDVEINKLFDFANKTTDLPQGEFDSSAKKLALAEKFIDDLGVRSHYDKFLSEH